jgi:multisubunit Na+/H+ antiporter MnhB subunit
MKDELIIGILCITVGFIVVYISLRYQPKKESILLPTANGIIGGVLLIVIGIKYLLDL